MRRIAHVIEEDEHRNHAKVVFTLEGVQYRATLLKEELKTQRLIEKMVDSGVPEGDVLELAEAARDEGWAQCDEDKDSTL